MNPLISKLLSPRRIEYLTLNQDLIVLELSPHISQFADRPNELIPGKDVRLSFPELTGAEESLFQVLQGQQANFQLEGIARFPDDSSPFYISLYIFSYQEETNLEKQFIVLVEDVTEVMLLRQNLVQRASEAELLLSALSASRDYINKIILSMGDALFVTTAAGKIKTVNLSAQHLFGYSEAELVGQSLAQIISEQNYFLISQPPNFFADSESLFKLEITCPTKHGRDIVVEFYRSTIQSELEGSEDFIYIGRDITERKQAEIGTQKALEAEKALNDLKTQFIAMVSHEFRTPLTQIITSVDLLRYYHHKYSEAENLEYLQYIQNAADTMTHLLDNVLILGRSEVGKLIFNPIPLHLEFFCQVLIQELQIADNQHHQINFVSHGSCPISYMDENLLRHIFSNLLSNAMKYSPGDRTVDFEVWYQEKQALFEVRDRGIGIPPEDRDRLFESFHRGKNVGTISGTGLGLTIVKKAVDLHGGKLEFLSEVGVGTTFRVALPWQPLSL